MIYLATWSINSLLRSSYCMDSCHQPFFYSKFVIQDFSHRRKAVCCTRCIATRESTKNSKNGSFILVEDNRLYLTRLHMDFLSMKLKAYIHPRYTARQGTINIHLYMKIKPHQFMWQGVELLQFSSILIFFSAFWLLKWFDKFWSVVSTLECSGTQVSFSKQKQMIAKHIVPFSNCRKK